MIKNKDGLSRFRNYLVLTAIDIWMCSGRMSACPAYLGVVINNRLELDELFRYDLLILCPADFNLTFKVTLKYRYCPSLKYVHANFSVRLCYPTIEVFVWIDFSRLTSAKEMN